jgi:hypothetical protein
MARLVFHRNSSIALRYIEATIGLFDDLGLVWGLGHPSAQEYAQVNGPSGFPL